MISHFKAQLFCQETKLPRREVDATDPLWVERIDDFFKSQHILPPPGDPAEYAKAFEAVYPSELDRRTYIDSQVSLGRPSFAHRVLASLLSTGKAPCVFTTNFDNLVETATTVAGQLLEPSKRRNLVVAAIDSSERAKRCLDENDWPLLAKIHGDFQSVELKNTEGELAAQDARMRAVLIEACSRFALIVVGYSGRDASVVQALKDVLKERASFPGGIYWVTRSPSELLPAVRELLLAIISKGAEAHIVQSQNFDEFAGGVADVVSFDEVLEKHIREGRTQPIVRSMPLPTHEAIETPILRCSAVRILSLPKVARRLVLQKPAQIFELRQCLKESKARATVAAAGSDYAAFGSDEELLSALAKFGPTAAGTIELDPVAHSWALGLLYDALTRSLCKGRPFLPRLRRRGHSILVSAGYPDEDVERRRRRLESLSSMKGAYGESIYGNVQNLGYPFNEAVRIRFEQAAGHWWCVFDPYTNVDLPKNLEERVEGEPRLEEPMGYLWKPSPAADWIRERWAQRYNRKWSAIINAWSAAFEGEGRAFGLEEGKGIDAVFQIGSVTAWSRPSHDHPYFHGVR